MTSIPTFYHNSPTKIHHVIRHSHHINMVDLAQHLELGKELLRFAGLHFLYCHFLIFFSGKANLASSVCVA